ncbi:hypothetical protein MERGE_002791 [Pneumocystis wakefieldiae]|uniref:Mannosyl-oligosaccharide glucosidase n=1 Tax=Pneumocystis wakefieldiae TaxID=38082 RepID=A0A899G1X7_9ASCO|nr:hypothetical protein MERGE_002791 [Pneumocystis wakefieldiae]
MIFYRKLIFIILLIKEWKIIYTETDTSEWLVKEAEMAENASLFWGPYRPNLYMGIRSRDPDGMLMGIMWTGVDNYTQIREMRHTCEQNDNIKMYGWEEFDIRKGGRQIIKDDGMNIEIEMEFAKIYTEKHNGNWGLRIKGKTSNGTILMIASGNNEIKLISKLEKKGVKGDVVFMNKTSKKKIIEITQGPSTNAHPLFTHEAENEKYLDRFMYHSMKVSKKKMWMAKDLLYSVLILAAKDYYEKYNENTPPAALYYTLPNIDEEGNFHLVQRVFQGPFEFDILYSSTDDPMTSYQLENEIISNSKLFKERFMEIFSFKDPFNSDKYMVFAQNLLSNLLGNIGYFYGDSIVDKTYTYEYQEILEEYNSYISPQVQGPFSLFTSTPSRSFFPRGFYWDEGFHLLLIGHWDNDLRHFINNSWFSLIDEDGWIAREQILGDESRSKVPKEFIIQYSNCANPPTLILPIISFIEKLEQNNRNQTDQGNKEENIYSKYIKYPQLAINYLKEIYPLISRQYNWYRRTQQGEIERWNRNAFSSDEGYRWRGCTPQHCFASGLDDYPRAYPHNGELHLDLLSWMGLFTKGLRMIAEKIGYQEDVEKYISIEDAIVKNIDDLHWSDEHNAYCDCTIDEKNLSIHECHIGYVTIFPLLTGLLSASSPRFDRLLDIIYSPDHLWSSYGLRSLSIKSPYYGKDENYWRGPIWININYMALQSLYKNYIHTPGPYQEKARKIYDELRVNVVNTVFHEWKRTHFAWEQYNQASGAGQRTKGFTGWTSLIKEDSFFFGKKRTDIDTYMGLFFSKTYMRETCVYLSGMTFSLGWWFFVDSVLYSSVVDAGKIHITLVDWIPCILSTAGMLM